MLCKSIRLSRLVNKRELFYPSVTSETPSVSSICKASCVRSVWWVLYLISAWRSVPLSTSIEDERRNPGRLSE